MKRYKIYQIKDDPQVAHGIKFAGLEELEKYGLRDKLTLDIYKQVYSDTIEDADISAQLECIYSSFQGSKPAGFTGHSVSISDVVHIDGRYYYCDLYGWTEIDLAPKSKQYKDLTINEKINAKSWGHWRLPNPAGFILTMIDNANSFNRKDYADFMRHHLAAPHEYSGPRPNTQNKPIYI